MLPHAEQRRFRIIATGGYDPEPPVEVIPFLIQ